MSTKCDRYGILASIAPQILEKLGKVGRSLSRDVLIGRHNRLTDITVNPRAYSDWREFFCDYQAASLLKKYPKLNLTVDREALALEKFLKSEKVCSTVNWRFSAPLTRFSHDTYRTLLRSRNIIAKILGDFSWDAAIQSCDFGPGSNVGIPRRSSHLCQKIGNSNPTVTGECLALLETYRRFDPHVGECSKGATLVRGSKATTVPKDARCDRFIAIEPLWNMFFQRGIGGMIRSRLRVSGLDLDKGQPINQELALRGSIDGSLSTIDLSAASDSIALSLVEFLLPEEWFRAMMTVRSPYCSLPDGTEVFLRKVSSMGNGFTFELESLIFYSFVKALSHGRPGRDVAVFGDDIILPSTDAKPLIGFLSEVGFKTNIEKTFIDGPFRESCGKHYFSGHDVTPFFLKKEISSYHDLFWLVNSIKRLSHRFVGISYGCDERFRDIWTTVVQMLPGRFQSLSCPDGYGDEAIVRDFDDCSPRPSIHSRGWQGFLSSALLNAGRSNDFEDLPGLISKLWFTRRGLELGEMSQYVRKSKPLTLRLKVRRRTYPQWSTLGPWVSLL